MDERTKTLLEKTPLLYSPLDDAAQAAARAGADQRWTGELFAQEEEEALELGALMAVEWSERLSFVPEGAWLVQLELVQPDQPEAGRRATLQT